MRIRMRIFSTAANKKLKSAVQIKVYWNAFLVSLVLEVSKHREEWSSWQSSKGKFGSS